MPARNEERYLAESVGRVLSQDYDGELELVLAVGPSADRTAQLARALAAADPRITVIDNPSGRIPVALNRALAVSRHPVVVRVDARSLLPDGYIRTAVRTLRDTGAANVGGVMAAEGVTVFQRAVAWAMTSPFGVGPARNHTGGGSGPAATAYLGVFRRTAIEQAGGFDERFEIAEDWELNHRIRCRGGLVWFQPELAVTYRPRTTVRELAVQYYRYGRWRREVCRQHPGTLSLRYLAPPLVVGGIGAGALAGLAGLTGLATGARGWPALLTSGLVVPLGYAAAIALVAARAKRDLPARVAARLPVALATMHLCWGAGFLTSPRGLAGTRTRLRRCRPAVRSSGAVSRADEGARDDQVLGVRDLEIALASADGSDRHLGEVAQHDTAVIGGRRRGETGVGVRALVGTPDDRQPKALRRLAARQRVTRQDALDSLACQLDDGVGGWHHHADGLPVVECGHAVRDDPLVDQRPGGVVEQHLGVSRSRVAEPGERPSRRLGPAGAAFDHRSELGNARQALPDLVLEARSGHDQYPVDAGSTVECPGTVLDQGASGEDAQLLRACCAEPAA